MQSGAIRIIGAISDGRSKYFPDAPTMAEQGFAEAQVSPLFGVVVPKGTPQPAAGQFCPFGRCFGMFPTARNTSYIAPDWSPARPT